MTAKDNYEEEDEEEEFSDIENMNNSNRVDNGRKSRAFEKNEEGKLELVKHNSNKYQLDPSDVMVDSLPSSQRNSKAEMQERA